MSVLTKSQLDDWKHKRPGMILQLEDLLDTIAVQAKRVSDLEKTLHAICDLASYSSAGVDGEKLREIHTLARAALAPKVMP